MNSIDYIFYEKLKELMQVNNRDTEAFEFRENKGNNSIYLNDFKHSNFYVTQRNAYICLNKCYLELADNEQIPYTRTKSKSDLVPVRVSISDLNIINDYAKFWLTLYDEELLRHSKDTFSCCIRYTQCSDAFGCINPDKQAKLLCKYNQNLKNGRIFYGKNSIFDKDGNVDENKVKYNFSIIPTSTINHIHL